MCVFGSAAGTAYDGSFVMAILGVSASSVGAIVGRAALFSRQQRVEGYVVPTLTSLSQPSAAELAINQRMSADSCGDPCGHSQ